MNVGEQERWETNKKGLLLIVRILLAVKVEDTAVYLYFSKAITHNAMSGTQKINNGSHILWIRSRQRTSVYT
jgi:hypothetical protein